VLVVSAATRLTGQQWFQIVTTLTINPTSTKVSNVPMEILEAIHGQDMTSNVSAIHTQSGTPAGPVILWRMSTLEQKTGSAVGPEKAVGKIAEASVKGQMDAYTSPGGGTAVVISAGKVRHSLVSDGQQLLVIAVFGPSL